MPRVVQIKPASPGFRAVLNQAARMGQGRDRTIAHVAPGELTIPRALQTPTVMAALKAAAEAKGVALERFFVGSKENRRNPVTGMRQFDDGDMGGDSGSAALGGDTGSGGPDLSGGGDMSYSGGLDVSSPDAVSVDGTVDNSGAGIAGAGSADESGGSGGFIGDTSGQYIDNTGATSGPAPGESTIFGDANHPAGGLGIGGADAQGGAIDNGRGGPAFGPGQQPNTSGTGGLGTPGSGVPQLSGGTVSNPISGAGERAGVGTPPLTGSTTDSFSSAMMRDQEQRQASSEAASPALTVGSPNVSGTSVQNQGVTGGAQVSTGDTPALVNVDNPAATTPESRIDNTASALGLAGGGGATGASMTGATGGAAGKSAAASGNLPFGLQFNEKTGTLMVPDLAGRMLDSGIKVSQQDMQNKDLMQAFATYGLNGWFGGLGKTVADPAGSLMTQAQTPSWGPLFQAIVGNIVAGGNKALLGAAMPVAGMSNLVNMLGSIGKTYSNPNATLGDYAKNAALAGLPGGDLIGKLVGSGGDVGKTLSGLLSDPLGAWAYTGPPVAGDVNALGGGGLTDNSAPAARTLLAGGGGTGGGGTGAGGGSTGGTGGTGGGTGGGGGSTGPGGPPTYYPVYGVDGQIVGWSTRPSTPPGLAEAA